MNTHVIADIAMHDDADSTLRPNHDQWTHVRKNWLRCSCGKEWLRSNPELLAQTYAFHKAAVGEEVDADDYEFR